VTPKPARARASKPDVGSPSAHETVVPLGDSTTTVTPDAPSQAAADAVGAVAIDTAPITTTGRTMVLAIRRITNAGPGDAGR
jgi:hypothetical protein